MRVALIGPVYPYRGGIAHYTTMLYRALRERGHDVLMVSFKRQYPRWLYPGRSDKDPSKRPLVVEDAKYWIDSLNPFTWLTTFWRIWRYQPDMIVLQWWTTFWAPVWWTIGTLARFLRIPLLYICHNVLPHETGWWDPWLVRCVLREGAFFITQSLEEKQRLLSLLPGVDVFVVPHPVYDMFTSQKWPKEEARRRLGLPMDALVLLFFGIVRGYKGLKDFLIELSRAPYQEPAGIRVLLVIAGEFWDDKSSYLQIIQDMGLGEQVVIEDRYIPNEEVPLYFSAADALVAPYRQETGSGVIQMARGMGLPVVRSLTQIFNDNENNALEPSLGWVDLVSLIEQLISSR
ncbi:MAG: glycosyltransferase [Candidatus Hadarchaeum sp.]|uniref:glycosyltransferase n=1 Tax=Candidatus Hadarchaeum sp. TaxID=2883567 RepID=UPI0031714315